MKTIRWGMIGTGRISSTFATALSGMSHTKMTGIASRDINKASEFARKFEIDHAYGSYEEMVENDEIDVIYIGTPHTEHVKNAALCIKAGKAVLCEKPFTTNVQDTKYLIDLAREHKVFLMEAMWTKFLPVTNAVKEWIDSDRIGDLKYLNINFGFVNIVDSNSRLFNPLLGGGALLDVGIYPITYASIIMNRLPDSIQSNATLGNTKVDELNSMLFQYHDGVIASLSSSITVDLGKDALIFGSKGKIVVENFWKSNKAFLYDNEDNLIEMVEKPFQVNGYEYEAMEVNQCIRDGLLESKTNPLKDSLDIMQILDNLRKQWKLNYPGE